MGWSVHHRIGLLHYAPQLSFRGYTLVCNARGDYAHLIDMEGRVCHRWQNDEGICYGYLLDNGHLLLRTQGAGGPPSEKDPENAILELDWDGNLVWAYRNPMVHHDFERLPNGNTLVPVFEEIPAELAAQVQGGRGNNSGSRAMFGDVVQEVTPGGMVVDEWHSWEVLVPEEDVICPLETRRMWTQQNALNVTGNGDLLVSFRQISTIGIVDRSSGKFIWKWGPEFIAHQHHPTYLDNGHVLLFDNGSHRGGPTYSRVLEVDPATSEIVWEYHGDPHISFYSFHISGAERLPNGNTLICEGAPGRLFEVTPDKEIVWEYINPYVSRSGVSLDPMRALNSVFRAHRYGPDHPALQGRDLDPSRYANLNRLYAGQ